MKTKSSVTKLVQLALLTAIIFVLANTPLGYIKLPIIQATTVHIPVIIGAVLLGVKGGAFLGGVFGLTSLINNTMAPTITSFVFSPFVSGSAWSIVVCFVPRILVGVVAAIVFNAIYKAVNKESIALIVAGFAGSMTNTILVMGGIYAIFGQSYAEAKGIAFDTLFKVILTVVGVNGVPEAIVAAILTLAIVKPLRKVINK